MKIEFEISDAEIIRSNKIGKEYLAEDNIFPPDIYYEGTVTLTDDANKTINQQYSLFDFTYRVFNALEDLESGKCSFLEIEFTEDYMSIRLLKQSDELFLKPEYENKELNFKFDEFKNSFTYATKDLYARLFSVQGSNILKKTENPDFNIFLSKLGM